MHLKPPDAGTSKNRQHVGGQYGQVGRAKHYAIPLFSDTSIRPMPSLQSCACVIDPFFHIHLSAMNCWISTIQQENTAHHSNLRASRYRRLEVSLSMSASALKPQPGSTRCPKKAPKSTSLHLQSCLLSFGGLRPENGTHPAQSQRTEAYVRWRPNGRVPPCLGDPCGLMCTPIGLEIMMEVDGHEVRKH